MPEGFSVGQFNERQVNLDVAALRNAVSELQATVNQLVRERNEGK